MNSVYILNSSLEIEAIINDYTAKQWHTIWGSGGSFTLWAPITSYNSQYLQIGNFVWFEYESIALIEDIQKETDEDTAQLSMKVSGRLFEVAALSSRIIWGRLLKTDYSNKIIEEIIKTQVTNPTDSNRKLDNILLVQNANNIGSSVTFVNSYGNVWDQVEQLNQAYNLDTRFVFNEENKNLTVLIRAGNDLSDEVIIDTDLGILKSAEYEKDVSSYCNTALIAGEGEGTDRVLAYIGSANKGLNRKELYVDARDLQKTNDDGFTMSSDDYNAALVLRGEQKLTENLAYESYDASIELNNNSAFIFGKDFSFGDIVTLVDYNLLVSVKARVNEVLISDDEDGEKITLTFGISSPTITKIIKRRG